MSNKLVLEKYKDIIGDHLEEEFMTALKTAEIVCNRSQVVTETMLSATIKKFLEFPFKGKL